MSSNIISNNLEMHYRIPDNFIGENKLFPEEMNIGRSNRYLLPRYIYKMVIAPAWKTFTKYNPRPSRAQVLKNAIEIDKRIIEYIKPIK